MDEYIGVLVFAPDAGHLTPHPPRAIGHALCVRVLPCPLHALTVGHLYKPATVFRHVLSDEQLPAIQIRAVLCDVRGSPRVLDAQVGRVDDLTPQDNDVTSVSSGPALLSLGIRPTAYGCEGEDDGDDSSIHKKRFTSSFTCKTLIPPNLYP